SGGKGLQVLVPLAPAHDFEAVRAWVKSVAERLAATNPDLIAVASGGTHRGDHVSIDYAQNSVGRNTAAPYTARARPTAPVSTPLTWEEVASGKVEPTDFTLQTVPSRLAKLGDVFAPALSRDQHLS